MNGFSRGLLFGLLAAIPLAAAAATLATRQLRRRLTRSEKAVRQAERLAEVGTLTGGLAHEIKNPLSTVGLNLQLLDEDLDPAIPGYDRLHNRLATVQRETTRLRDILDDFLRYAGKIELDPRQIDLNALLEEMTDFFAPQAQLQRVQLRLKSEPQPVIVRADEKLLKQAVLNLMLNAVQAMPDGGELILSAGRSGDRAVIDVVDTGPGISAEVMDKIFHAYYSNRGRTWGNAVCHQRDRKRIGFRPVAPAGAARITPRVSHGRKPQSQHANPGRR
jgi:signal transduction histidine kinase